MHTPRRALGAVLIVLFGVGLLAACGKSGAPDATPTARVPDRSDEAGSLAAADTTTSTAPPSDQADFAAVMRQILARRDEAYEQNRPDYLDEIYLPQCKCLAGEKAELARRIAEGVHTAGKRLTVIRVETINLNGADEAAVRVVYRQGPHRLVNSDGETVREQAPEPPTALAFFLGRADGRWKVISITPEGPASEEEP